MPPTDRMDDLLFSASGSPCASLAEGLTVPSGPPFFRWLVRYLAENLGCEYALVGQVCGEDWSRLRSLAIWGDGRHQEACEYDLEGTPCCAVLEGLSCAYGRNVAELFPRDELLRTMGVESYAGVALIDESERPLGLVVAMDTRPMADTGRATRLLEAFRPRVTAELAMLRENGELKQLMEATSGLGPASGMEPLATSLAQILNVRCAFISGFVEGGTYDARILGACLDGKTRSGDQYDIRGTPCEMLFETGLVFHPSGIRELYPHSDFLAGMQAESYLGMALCDEEGQALGHMGVIHDRPLSDQLHALSILQVFAARVRAELQRKLAEERRRETDRRLWEAQRTDSLIRLAGGIAHDFNNLLMGITGNVSMAIRETADSPELRSMLEDAETAARRAADLGGQLAAYTGQANTVLEPLDVGELVREMARLLAASTPKEARLVTEVAEEALVVQGDATQLRQVIMNLVVNGAEALKGGSGRVLLRTRRDRGQAVIEVEDQGCGMDATVRSRIFDPFFSTKFAGRGLGLAAVQGIVRRHGGQIAVKSAPGRGSRFRISMPASDEPVPARTDERSAGDAREVGGLVLIVDDDEAVLDTVQRMVARLGFEPVTAPGGREALSLLRVNGSRLRLALVDMTMPNMRGDELVRAIRERHAHLPVLLMSGYSEEDIGASLLAELDARLIQKPFRTRDLQERIQQVTSGRQAATPT